MAAAGPDEHDAVKVRGAAIAPHEATSTASSWYVDRLVRRPVLQGVWIKDHSDHGCLYFEVQTVNS